MSGIRISASAVVTTPKVASGSFTSQDFRLAPLSVTGLGFTPTVVLFFNNRIAPAGGGSFDPIWSVGLSDGVTQRCWEMGEERGADPSNAERSIVDDQVARVTALYGAAWELELVSLDADGFTVAAVTAPNAFNSDDLFWLAFDCEVEIATGTLPATAGGTSSVALSKTPSAILVLRDGLEANVADMEFSLGWAVGAGAGEQAVAAVGSEDGHTVERNSNTLLRAGWVMSRLVPDGTSNGAWSVSDYGSSIEFTCEEDGTADVLVLALHGIQAAVGVETAPTTGPNGSTTDTLTGGFPPVMAMFMHCARPGSVSTQEGEATFGWGWAQNPNGAYATEGSTHQFSGSVGGQGDSNVGDELEVSSDTRCAVFRRSAGQGAETSVNVVPADDDSDWLSTGVTVAYYGPNDGSSDVGGFSPPAPAYEYLWLLLG